MKATVLSGPSPRSVWSVHRNVLLGLATLGVTLTVLVWLHPTLGYADPGSIIAGADLRADLTLILWLLLGVFAAVASIGIQAASRFTARKLVVLPAAYAVAAAALPLAMLVIDKYV